MRSFEPACRQASPASRRHAFSLVELLVVLGILIILCSIFIPYVGKMRETNRRVSCTDNLRQVYAALKMYANANGYELPRVPSDPSAPAMYTAFTGASYVTPLPPPLIALATGPASAPTTAPSDKPEAPRVALDLPLPPPTTAPATRPATQPTTSPATVPISQPAKTAVQFNDVTASLWLTVRLGYVMAEAFVCPSADETVDPMLTNGKRVPVVQRSNFTSSHHLSYSYSSPYSAAPRFRLNSDTLPPDFAIMADQNPGIGRKDSSASLPGYDAPPLQLAAINSRNHDRAGQNVLYVTGEVRFQTTPYCGVGTGWQRDNIYTALARKPLPADSHPSPEGKGVLANDIGPAWEHDSYLVPTDDE